jgi:membrane-bound serine protease (ClpP class)
MAHAIASTSGAPGRRRQRRAARLVLLGLVAALGLTLLGPMASAQQRAVLRTEVRGVITPVVTGHVEDAITEAEAGGYEALLIEIDTPGGLESSMREIVQHVLAARVPVIVYVSPQGARAASAGAIITFAAHVAAMSPGTAIGAATPVPLGGDGELSEEMANKIINDATAYAEALAQLRDRDEEFIVETVTEGRSASANEALELGAIDVIAASTTALMNDIDGMTVVVDPASVEDPEGTGTTVELATAGAPLVDYEMSFTRRILQALANPELALLFLSIGTLGIIYELASPGGIVGGVIGAVMLVLAFFSLAVLPVDLAGVLLLVLALALFAAELFVPGVGAFAGGGAIALVFAGIFLFQRPTGVGIDLSFIVPIALAMALAAIVIGRFAWRTQRSEPYTGQGGTMVGAVGTVRESNGQTGRIFVGGQLWKARSTEGTLHRGDQVEVVAMDGLELTVRPHVAGEPVTQPIDGERTS